MSILVDYRCTGCGDHTERWMPSPPPPAIVCACGAESRRRFAAVGLFRERAAAAGASPFPRRQTPPLCAQYPQIPGLCHMSESAARMWVAKYTGDRRTVDREQERQESAAAVAPPTMSDAISHQHRTNKAQPTSSGPEVG